MTVRSASRSNRLAHSLRLGESLVFCGWLGPPEIEDELAAAWASVVPSLWAEPLGLVAVEAAVRGVPVVASAMGGLPEIVVHGRNGLLFPNGDETALSSCLSEISEGRAFPDHTVPASAVRNIAERHDLRRHVTRFEEIRDEIAGKYGSASGPAAPVESPVNPRPNGVRSTGCVSGPARCRPDRVTRGEEESMGNRFPLFIAGAGTLVALAMGSYALAGPGGAGEPPQTRTFHAQLNALPGGAVRLEHGFR